MEEAVAAEDMDNVGEPLPLSPCNHLSCSPDACNVLVLYPFCHHNNHRRSVEQLQPDVVVAVGDDGDLCVVRALHRMLR